jgi:hypothetical protein
MTETEAAALIPSMPAMAWPPRMMVHPGITEVNAAFVELIQHAHELGYSRCVPDLEEAWRRAIAEVGRV